MNTNETPVTIGVEVEHPYPTKFPSEAVKKTAHAAYVEFWKKQEAEAIRSLSATAGSYDGYTKLSLDNFHPTQALGLNTGAKPGPEGRKWASHDWEEGLPVEFRSPEGWERGWEGQHEFRFRGATDTLREVCTRLDNLGAYFKAWEHPASTNSYGTHVHFGVPAWIDKRFVKHRSEAHELVKAAIILRHRHLLSLLEPNRRAHNAGGSFPSQFHSGSTPLWRLHTYLSTGGFTGSTAMQIYRKGIPTFEVRVFESTSNTDAIKGWIALLVSMLKNCERLMTEEVLDSVKTTSPSATGHKPLTAGIIVNPAEFTIEHLKDEIRETGFWSAPLCSWIDETLRHGGNPTPFEGTLHEIYTDSGSAKGRAPKTSTRTKKSGGRVYDMPQAMEAAA